jgi:glutamate-ammonia-ligase adenylyltransferase
MHPHSHKPDFPLPADHAAGQRLIEDFSELGPAEAALATSPAGRTLLASLGGNAPYLADLACRESATLLTCMAAGPDASFAAVLETVRELPPATPRSTLGAALRQAKRQAALCIALADIGGLWPLEQITRALSDLAEHSLRAATDHLLLGLHEAGKITLPHPEAPSKACGFVALALGKLGAFELNYSSDIDLVLLFDPAAPPYDDEATSIMARLARDLTALLATRDEGGYVFRVDLRLRPDPSATPPVVALPTAYTYYEAHGRTWERAAFSKARPIAGDIALGHEFLAHIRPFIWRKYLDFAAISDIHEMKRQIDAFTGGHGLLGLDVKRGRGGIREIEFIVQTLGLVWGGAEPALRIPATLEALPAMARAKHIPERAARELAADYRLLRQVEHRLQMVADRQTHALPSTEEGFSAFITFMGDPTFRRSFPRLLARVHGHFAAFFGASALATPQGSFDPGGDGPPPEAFTTTLTKLGFGDIRHIAERLRAWNSGTMPALRAERARELLAGLLPELLHALSGQPEPDKAFGHFDTLLSRQRAGVQLLSLFRRNPALLRRLVAVLGASPALADYLAEDAQALEALLVPAARFAKPKPVLRRQLAEAADLEQATAITRRFIRQEEFHISVATLEGRMDADEAGRHRTALAEAAISALLPRVLAAHKARHGTVRGGQFAVVVLGKAGAGEMLAGSDLDLMIIYDHGPNVEAPSAYFVRACHAFTGALTARGSEGQLYHVDMRLRPSGNQGPVAVSLAAFKRYHATDSWTWERLALTRARVIAATPGFAPKVRAAIAQALTRPVDGALIKTDTVAMQERIATELPPKGLFDVKTREGGMMEVVFIAQALQLIHGPEQPALLHPNTVAAFKALQAAGIIAEDDAKTLINAERLWRTVQGMNRITGLSERATQPPAAMLAPLLRATGTVDLATLTAKMEEVGQSVRACFNRLIKNN